MSQEAGHLSGGASIYMRFPVRASMLTAGVPAVSITDAVGLQAASTTVAQDAVGLALDTATYSSTQSALGSGEVNTEGPRGTFTGLDMGRMVTVSVRPDLIIRSLVSNGATAGTALALLTNTSASAGGTTISDSTNIPSADMKSGTVWCLTGANVGHARIITTHTASVSFVVTVPFPRAIAVGDTFLFVPYTAWGTFAASLDGSNAVQFTTNIDQADGAIASGTGAEALVFNLELRGRTDTKVSYMLRDHQWNRHTVPS